MTEPLTGSAESNEGRAHIMTDSDIEQMRLKAEVQALRESDEDEGEQEDDDE